MANLIVCCDGTWATAENMTDGVPTPTNVVKIHSALAGEDATGQPQHRYYHPGVGTEGGLYDKVLGGGTGLGLDQNIKSAYHWLAGTYAPGDKIFLFGFSRGAYTVRSLGGMISVCGLLDFGAMPASSKKQWARVDKVFENYRAEAENRPALTGLQFHNAKKGRQGKGKTLIHFLGVWDTVGSLGIPDELELANLFDDASKHTFHDTGLSAVVKTARHALAMDEPRGTFAPTRWTKVSNSTDCKEIWFPGAHSDVGGGYIQCGLSDGALHWMMTEAAQHDLNFRDGTFEQLSPNPLDVLHDPITGIYKGFKSRPRSVPCLTDADAPDRFHCSAIQRHENPPLAQPDYWPTRQLKTGGEVALDIFARQKWNATGLFVKKGEKYKLTAKGEWLDASVICGPDGPKDGDFQPGEILHVLASGWGKVEELFKKVTDNEMADFKFTRRREDMPWFCLVGVIANGLVESDQGKRVPHQTFKIGKAHTLTPERDGYLSAFANDAWQMYDNNRGSVQLVVKRTA